jgi:hypothetical protein
VIALRLTLFGLLSFALPVVSAQATCGTHGGPGYRGPDGRCVGWSNLQQMCGNPPTTRCASEMAGINKPAYVFAPPAPPQSTAPNNREWPHPPRTIGRLPLNPDVTPETLGQTICVRGWTATVRPPVSYTNAVKVRLIREQGLPLELIGDFQLDHKMPLALGGAPSDPRNLQLEDEDDAERKDGVEKCLSKAVCAGRISLQEAQRRIWADWREAGKACY